MVCSTAILSSSLALSLLRHSSPSNQSFVFSPFSLNTALSVIHDGAGGETQKELTNYLLNGCDPSDVTDLYSALVHSIITANGTGVSFKFAKGFYVDNSVSLRPEYQKHIRAKYNAKVVNINLTNKVFAANRMNKFINQTTNGNIDHVISADSIDKEMQFMTQRNYFRANLNSDVGTLLIMPYQDERFNFFYLMPNETSNIEKMRNELTGEQLIALLKDQGETYLDIFVPKFKIESELHGKEVLSKMEVTRIFEKSANLAKISPDELFVNRIQHNVVLETNEEGTEAAASTVVGMAPGSSLYSPPSIRIDRPFLFGITRDEDILFLGQVV